MNYKLADLAIGILAVALAGILGALTHGLR